MKKWNKKNKSKSKLRNGKRGRVKLDIGTKTAKPENWGQKGEIGRSEIRKCETRKMNSEK